MTTSSMSGRSGLRIALSLLAVAFTAYLAVGALIWTSAPAHPIVQVGAVLVGQRADGDEPQDRTDRVAHRRIVPAPDEGRDELEDEHDDERDDDREGAHVGEAGADLLGTVHGATS